MGWVTADAPTPAELAACVECGLCLPSCPTFRLTGMETASPRGRLNAMAAVAEGILEVDEAFAETMSYCLGCRACEVVCPSMVPFGRAMEGARVELAAQLPSRRRRSKNFVFGRLVDSRPALALASFGARVGQQSPFGSLVPPSLRRSFKGLRPLRRRPASLRGSIHPTREASQGTAALFLGCVMDEWFRPVHQATLQVLTRAGWDVIVPAAQGCCGALAAHEGAADGARRMARKNMRALDRADVVVVDAAGCGAHLKEYGAWMGSKGAAFSDKVMDVTEIVAEAIDEGRLPTHVGGRGPVTLQEPCHLRNAQRVSEAPRTLLRAAGLEINEIDSMCCGAAGAYVTQYPETASELGARKADEVRAAGSSVVASANPGCEMQLRGHLESWFRIAHPVELYWESLEG